MDEDWVIAGLDVCRLSGKVEILTSEPNGPLHVESSLNIHHDGDFANKIAPLLFGDGDGGAVTLLIDGNQIEQTRLVDGLYLNFDSPCPILMAVGGGNVSIGTGRDPGSRPASSHCPTPVLPPAAIRSSRSAMAAAATGFMAL